MRNINLNDNELNLINKALTFLHNDYQIELSRLNNHKISTRGGNDDIYEELNSSVKHIKVLKNKLNNVEESSYEITPPPKKITRKRWTVEEFAILKDYFPMLGGDVCEHLEGRSKFACREMATKLGLKTDICKVVCVDTGEIFNSLKEVSESVGVAISTIWNACKNKTPLVKNNFYYVFAKDFDRELAYHMVKEKEKVMKDKPVYCYELMRLFKNIEEASECTKAIPLNILKCCRKERQTTKGYHWAFAIL